MAAPPSLSLGGGGAGGRPAALHALRLELSTRRPSGGEASGRPAVLHALRLELSMRRASGGDLLDSLTSGSKAVG